MPKTTKKILCYTAITSILNLSFQPAYAVKIEMLDDTANHSCSRPLMKEDLSLEDPQTHATSAPQSATEADVVSWFFSTPLKTMIGAVSLVKQGVRFVLGNPGKAITMGLLLQARTATSTLSLSGLTPLQGFNISGAAANDESGYDVSSAGDFNGDGLDDVIIGARLANNGTGNSYIIYGTNSKPSLISLSFLTPIQGFAISGATRNDLSGYTVSSAGDFNGDGLGDVIIGGHSGNPTHKNSYVIYGTNSMPPSISLSSLTPLQGFAIIDDVEGSNYANLYESGYTVSLAGDFNGDGLSDVIIGVEGANSGAGNSYVIYGTNSTPSSMSFLSLTPLQGFNITGAAYNDQSGYSVSTAGDFNGDGFDDIIVGAHRANSYTGKSYIIYGTNSTLSSISLSSLTPLQGLTINGAARWDESGISVSPAGDFNGDGLDDVIIGANRVNSYTGKSYIIYGTKTPPNSMNLSSLTPLQGFTINGTAANDHFGFSASSAGDFNGDGLDDVIIGAFRANSGVGNSYLIYGTNSAPSSMNLTSLSPQRGFTINGTGAGYYCGRSVSSAGDFNGDGLSDAIIGVFGANNNAGNSYVLYGAPSPASTSSSMESTGTSTSTLSKWLAGAALLIGQERF